MARSRLWLAGAVGPRLAGLPQTLTQMPADVRVTLWSRAADIHPKALYDLIPTGVKTSGNDVLTFLAKRDLSHIQSKYFRPDLANDIKNVLFERSPWNRSRSIRNMKPWEVARVRLDNLAEGVLKGARATTIAAARGALAGALMELPVTAAENIILVRGSAKTKKEALTDAGSDVGKGAAAGAAGAIVVTGIAMAGVPMAPAVVIPVTVVGGTLYTWSAAKRIWRARARVAELAKLGIEVPPPRTGPPALPPRAGQGRRRTRRRFYPQRNRQYRFPRQSLTIRATSSVRRPMRKALECRRSARSTTG